MKKLVIIMMAFLVLTTSAFAYNNTFTDISSHWGKDFITALTDKGIIAGYKESDGTYTFKPEKNISVAEFIVLVMKSQNQTVEPTESGYWAKPWIDKAYELGYIDDSYQNFDRYITREEMAEVAYNALSKSEYMSTVDVEPLLEHIKDYASISPSKEDEVRSIYVMGIMSGTPEKKFIPQGSATRAEASVVISRLIDKSIRNKLEFNVPSFTYKSSEYDPIAAKSVYKEGIAFAKTDKNGILQDEIVKAFEIFRSQINDAYTAQLSDPNIEQDWKDKLQTLDWTEFTSFMLEGERMEMAGNYLPGNEKVLITIFKNMSKVVNGVYTPELVHYVNLSFMNFAIEVADYPYHLSFRTYDNFEEWKSYTEEYMMPYYELLFEEDTQMVLDLAYDYMKKAPNDSYLQEDKFNNYREKFTLKNGREISFFINKDSTVLNIGLDNK